MIGLHNGIPKLPGFVRWYGGKGQFLTNLIPLILWSQVYCEPYGGAASLLLNLRPRPVEIYNDLHGDLVNLARVLQDPEQCAQLEYRLERTLYAREEFRYALQILENPNAENILRAWAFFVAHNQGFGGLAECDGNWGRGFLSRRNQSEPTSRWRNRVARIPEYMKRLARVQIDSVDAIKCIQFWDRSETTFYLDPPYVHETRTSSNDYAHEMDLEAHEKLVTTLLNIKGMAILSCYAHSVYEPLVANDWHKLDFETAVHIANARGKDSRSKRIETVLLNPPAWQHYDRQLSLAI